MSDPWQAHVDALGQFIRAQRQLAKLSLRELADRARVSNPYLSQIERGMHEPSVRVLKAIAAALGLPAETLLAEAGLFADGNGNGDGNGDAPPVTEAAIRADGALTDEQKNALLAVYRSYVAANHG